MIWRLAEVWPDHCPGGCYKFTRYPERHPSGNWHVPRDMFHGRIPWRTAPQYGIPD